MNWLQKALLSLIVPTRVKMMLVDTWRDGHPEYVARHFRNNVEHGFRKNELINACISCTADTASQLELLVQDRGGKNLPDNPLTMLLDNPNPHMSGYDFLWSVIAFQYLAGGAYYEKVRPENSRQVVALYPLRPDWVEIIPSSQTFIGGYRYGPPGTEKTSLKPEDVLRFPLFDPLDFYKGHPPVSVAGRVTDTDNNMTDFIKLFFEKGAVPPGYLKTKYRNIKESEVDRIRKAWMDRYGGFREWLGPAVLDADAEYIRTGLNFEEMGSGVLDERSESRICMAMRVPPMIVGARLDSATYSNYEVAERAWWRNRLLPLYQSILDTIKRDLLPEFDSKLVVKFDTSSVQALQEDTTSRWTRATNAWRAGAITRNQFLVEVGKEPLGNEGDVYLLPAGLDTFPGGMASRQPITRTRVHSHFPAALPSGKEGEAPNDDQRRQDEHKLTGSLTDYFTGQLARIKEAVESGSL